MEGNGKPASAPEEDRVFGTEVMEFVANVLGRTEWLRSALSTTDRDMYAASKCPHPNSIDPMMLREMFRFNPIASRVVEFLAKESWLVTPEVYEVEDEGTETPFEKAWGEVNKTIRSGGIKSYFQDTSGSAVWEALARADVLSGIGHYGAVLLGLKDGEADLSLEAVRKPGMELAYLRPLSEMECRIVQFDDNRASPRFSLPTLYEIGGVSPDHINTSSGQVQPAESFLVHWTRILHIADTDHQASSGEVFAVPRQEPVYYQLLGLMKLYLASPEMFWKAGLAGIVLKTQPQTGGDVPLDKAKIRRMMHDWDNEIQRYIALKGMDAETLAPSVSDPTPFINLLLEAICIKGGFPVRIFKGSERGELASSQDEDAWIDRRKLRQRSYVTPRIIVPFVDRLIYLGILPEPEGYSVDWPDLYQMSDQEKAELAKARTTAMGEYVSKQVDNLMAPMEYLTLVMGFTAGEAEMIMEAAAEYVEEKQEEQARLQEEQLENMKELNPPPDPNAPPNEGAPPNGKPPPVAPPAPKVPPAFARNEDDSEPPSDNVELEDYDTGEPIVNAKSKLSGGRWVTLRGVHVYLKGGKIVAGPKGLKDEVERGKKSKSNEPDKPTKDSTKDKPKPRAEPKDDKRKIPDQPDKDKSDKPKTKDELIPTHKELAAKMPELSEEQFEAVGDYTSGRYVEINKSLREGREATKAASSIPLIEKAIDSAPVLKEPVTLYRGLRMNKADGEEFLNNAKRAAESGGVIQDKAFVSASLRHDVASGFSAGGSGSESPIVVQIAARKGLYLGESVGGTKEMEMVLQRGTKFRVIGVEGRTVRVEQVLD